MTNTDIFTGDFKNLVDGDLTPEDVADAIAFFAGAADKFSDISLDTVVYLNQILGLATYAQDEDDYVDYTSVDYDRFDTWGNAVVTLLVPEVQPDGTTNWVPQEVNLYESVFENENLEAADADGFAAAANDALQVIEYIHEYEVPAETVTVN